MIKKTAVLKSAAVFLLLLREPPVSLAKSLPVRARAVAINRHGNHHV
tara:strand:+ start:1203 stop:1343 length:141 start_codon:yes stop_codon:yes gene_type:complete